MVLNRVVVLAESVAKGDPGPSSSTNSCTFHGEIFVIADSALCNDADRRNSAPHIETPCIGVKFDLTTSPDIAPDAKTFLTFSKKYIKAPLTM